MSIAPQLLWKQLRGHRPGHKAAKQPLESRACMHKLSEAGRIEAAQAPVDVLSSCLKLEDQVSGYDGAEGWELLYSSPVRQLKQDL
ncbi:MAG: hypothetical protein DRN96_08845 [Thermoproteota archaeon]|nr:MAG: hypothetical protein DRN96_08845 [Candidatus Korarchaeota archaeon]RLG51825.1 MAG: hypothetical protein DRN99_08200 [Candidatus Korarchaeota archaeon]